MAVTDLFLAQPVLTGLRVRLEPLDGRWSASVWADLQDPDAMRTTGTHATFTRPQIEEWLATRPAQGDRADWAVVAAEDGRWLGEAVINDYDADNSSAGYRIALTASARGRGHGTEVTRLVVAYALDVAGLHRLGLEVFAFNAPARAVYERCGFRVEGVRRDALRWDGAWHDAIDMAILAGDPHTGPASLHHPAGRVRAATAADVPAVLAFWVDAAEGTDRHDDRAAVLALLARDPAALMLLEDAGGIAATLIAGWDGWRASLYRLAVRPDRRRAGLAAALLAEAERRFAQAGAFRADAMVLNVNTDAHRVWAAGGYVRQPEWSRWVKRL